ncbi:MAG: 3,4-dihydroxy-2-butanone-4-phosphate synthase [Euryarchaeota archaeon]|nr:3,4-dihydroxy-2-butanone-4-phosphate synthase [Euryarchaeota archaeon]
MIKKALKAFKNGEIVLVFDDDNRERETDMIVAAEFITSQHIATMRNDAGGLICASISPETSKKLGIPFMTQIMDFSNGKFPMLAELSPTDIPYDERSAFSISINHRKTFTGITDNDRALTIRELAMLCKNEDFQNFGNYFRSPGHVQLLRATKGLLLKRQGHTEISVALAEMCGLEPIAVVCEMMDDNSGNSLSTEDVQKYADKEDRVFLSGNDVIEDYIKFIKE